MNRRSVIEAKEKALLPISMALFSQHRSQGWGEVGDRRHRQRMRRSLVLSGVSTVVLFVILILALRRHPEWYEPVGALPN